ncbi:hypothetical protein OAF24_03875, partial [bacterium]|nr:hypothetical protein [bacterium]
RSGAASGEYNVSITVGGMSVAGADGSDGPPPEAPPEPKLYVLKSTVGQKATNINFELDEIPSNE